MKYIHYNDNKISKLSLGTVQFGLDYGIANNIGKPTEENVKIIIDYLYSQGLNCFDTAQDYGDSEKVVGNSIEDKENLFVISKIKSNNFKKNIEENILKSLNNLRIRPLSGLLLHDSDLLYDWKDEYSHIVTKLIASGHINYFGVSIYTSEDFNLAMKNEEIKIIQIPFNMFDQRAISEKWFQRAKEKNKLLFIRSIFLQGLLLMDKQTIPISLNKANAYIDIFEKFCSKLGMSKNELAISFVNSVAKDSSLLFGCDNLEQAKQNLNTYNNIKTLSISVIKEIHEAFKDISESVYNPSKWNIK